MGQAVKRKIQERRNMPEPGGKPLLRVIPKDPLDILEVERRFLRACKTVRALPDPERRFTAYNNAWPEFIRDVSEAYGYAEALMPRFRPTPFDVSDMLDALAWARGLQENEFKLAWWRSFDLSFGQISRRLGKSDETARRYYREVMVKVWGTANYPQ